ncbi:hypothetical protein [Palleronia caenipelagi]|uniref:Uncharacterized protein n=1 Tax=Palleronia caenipelagi TaxID=2489174 RepID=A0A547Q680_9RHOB|nr:hypothetical protein [Palleronia caenipelagi]TRD21882.1 hypothetical protein FEV53_07485 [Palleronia caenipelagi]
MNRRHRNPRKIPAAELRQRLEKLAGWMVEDEQRMTAWAPIFQRLEAIIDGVEAEQNGDVMARVRAKAAQSLMAP